DGAGGIRSVDPHVILCCDVYSSTRDPDDGAVRARELRAGLFVLGSVLAAGEKLHLEATLYEAAERPRAAARASVQGDLSRIFDMVDQLTASLLTGRAGGPGARLIRMAAVATSSFAALRAYLDGEKEMRAMRRIPATEAYQRAVAEDPSFALAWYRLGVAALWSGQSRLARHASEQAVEHADRLSARDRRLLEAFGAALRGDNEEAERRFRAIVGEHPDDVEAWYQLAEMQFHCCSLHGRRVEQSRAAWERLLALDPRHAMGLLHLAAVESCAGRQGEAREVLSRLLEVSSDGDLSRWVRVPRALAGDDATARREMLDQMRRASDFELVYGSYALAAYFGRVDEALEISRQLADPVRSPEVRALGHAQAAWLLARRGRWLDALEELQQAERRQEWRGLESRAFLSALPFFPVAAGELERLVERLERLGPPAAHPGAQPGGWLNPHEGQEESLRVYLSGLLQARLGRADKALEQAARLDREAPQGQSGSLVRDLASGLRARALASLGRHQEALDLLEATRRRTRFDLMIWSPHHSQALARFTRAELLALLGREEEALRWLGSFAENSLFDHVFAAPARLLSAELLQRLGRPGEAAGEYRAFEALWGACDETLAPQLRRAAVSRARLEG
ncbi:MAG TPA: tetratricopeptide repeat protein, partial [Candidatus Polarisedimenticolia bacterium]|nr:tetratricopeptide repeat protein [Candidatus Polarisedimenticolia bacterium]